MKVSLNWLRDYVDITLPYQELAHRLSLSGTEVSGIQVIGGEWDRDKVLVARITKLERHPNADRLQLATVSLGDEAHTVVCGAWNIGEGDVVAFAKVGARLLDGNTGEPTVLREARIRGVASAGMVCSEKELGLGEDHTGILILPPDAPVGAPLADYLGDVVLDLEITPNRPDCLSMLGVAREVAALTEQEVREPRAEYSETGAPVRRMASVEIGDPELCPRYCASVVTDVTVGPSPPWMQQRLRAAGMRPINNLVDITNYVMLEYGQPLHAFDYERLRDHKIVVRPAKAGEIMTTLDGVERALAPDMLLICDGAGPVALAGVMGGHESEVTEGTTTVLLESANFDRVSIRRTSGRLRLRSEASTRFDKGLSPELPLPALRRATQLLVELAGGKAAKGIIDVYPGRHTQQPIHLTYRQIQRVLGLELGQEQVQRTLSALGVLCEPTADGFSVTAPYWRTDLRIPEDLVEELARIIGYDAIPTTAISGPVPSYQPDPLRELRERVRDALASHGLQEIITYSLTSRALLERLAPHPPVQEVEPLRMANPMSPEQEILRTTLRASLLTTLAANERHQRGGLRLFEMGRVYLPREGQLPEEREVAAGVLGGQRQSPSWHGEEVPVDFFEAKGALEVLFQALGLMPSFVPAEDANLLAGRTAQLAVGAMPVGIMGELHPEIARRFDILSQPVFLFEVDLAALLPLLPESPRYQPLSRFPGVIHDMAIVVDDQVPAERVRQILLRSPLVSQALVFDVYVGPQVPPGQKSLAYSVTYQAPDRTLSGEEVERARRGILDRLRRELGATLRA